MYTEFEGPHSVGGQFYKMFVTQHKAAWPGCTGGAQFCMLCLPAAAVPVPHWAPRRGGLRSVHAGHVAPLLCRFPLRLQRRL